MEVNDIARSRLAELGRGKGRTLPHRELHSYRRCAECGQMHPARRKNCPKCSAKQPPMPKAKCRLCDEPLPSRRRAWCSDDCLDAYFMVISSSHVRAKVFERDRGVCTECGLDTGGLENRIRRLPREAQRAAHHMLGTLGFDTASDWRILSLWCADHIEPLAEGGGYGLDNVQTLCTPCHKEKTAEQAGRKAKQRKLIGKKFLETRKRRLETIGAFQRSAGAS